MKRMNVKPCVGSALDSCDGAQVYDLAAKVCETCGNMGHKFLISQNKNRQQLACLLTACYLGYYPPLCFHAIFGHVPYVHTVCYHGF
jgi:hypothetical protein